MRSLSTLSRKTRAGIRQEPVVALTEVPGDGLDASTRRKDDKT